MLDVTKEEHGCLTAVLWALFLLTGVGAPNVQWLARRLFFWFWLSSGLASAL